MKKTFLVAFVTFLAIAFAMPSLADTATINGVKWTYTVSNGEASVGGGSLLSTAVSTSTSGTLAIPSSINGYSVRRIKEYAFYNCTNLTSVTIPNGVTSIGWEAFYNCKNLTSVTIPDSVTSILIGTFYNCKNLTSVTIPDSVTRIGSRAFMSCLSLTSITIPNRVTVIGDEAFNYCRGLTSITIPNRVTNIGEKAFYYCSSLKSIKIPNSVTNIGDNAFYYCSGIRDVTVPGRFIMSLILPSSYTLITKAIIENGVTSIGNSVFSGCSSLTSVTIPDSVTSIGNSAFSGCKGLTSVTIPDSVTSIGSDAFYNCWRLTSVRIPDSVTSIGNLAFSGCSRLMSVTLSDSLTSIGDCAFRDCDKCSETYVTITYMARWATNSINSKLRGTRHLIANGVEIKDFVIPDGVTSIGDYAFSGCTNLTSVAIPNSVTSVGDSAFSNCGSLTSVIIPDSVTRIGTRAFSDCRSLASIKLPDRVTSVGDSAFYNCWCLTTVTIPYSVTSIGESAFYNCGGLTSVTIPNSVTSIGSNAFNNCYRLTSVTIPDSVTSIGDYAFYFCKGLTSVMIHNSVTNIGAFAFNFCGLTSVTIPMSVRSIGECAFDNCSNLATAYVPFNCDVSYWAFPSVCTIVRYGIFNLLVSSACGEPVPEIGLHEVDIDDNQVTCSIDGSMINDGQGTRVVFTGWTGTGSVPESGTDTNVTFTITEDSSIIWNWTTNYWTEVSVIGGTCDFAPQWVVDGETVSVDIAPTYRLYSISISGDTEGVTFDGTALRFAADRPRSIAVDVEEVKVSLSVTSTHGVPTPTNGLHSLSCGAEVAASVAEPDPMGGIQFACTGWVGAGDVPAIGTSTNVTFTVTKDSSLTWTWTTNVWIECIVAGDATSIDTSGWHRLGGPNAVFMFDTTRTPYEYMLSGDTNGVVVDAVGKRIVIPSDQPRTVRLNVKVEAETFEGGGKPISWSTFDGWHVVDDTTSIGGSCLKSGATSANATSSIDATITGPGHLEFTWKISAGRGDYCRFYFDGSETRSISTRNGAMTSWATVTLDVPEGSHALRWSFLRGAGIAAGEDAAFLDNIDWRPDVALSVASAYGVPTPTNGIHTLSYGDEVTASVVEPEAIDGTRYVCVGWTGTGSVPEHGAETNVTFSITNDSSIVWNWRTNYWTEVSVTGGTCDFAPQWVADGESVAVEISPAFHLHAISLSGDTEGATLDGTTLRFTADSPRSIAVNVEEVKVSLSVASEYGVPTPTNGVHALSWGTDVIASVVTSEAVGGVQYACAGWTGTGSVPASGTGTNVTFQIEGDSSLTWNWRTNVWVSLALDGPVAADFTGAWVEKGSNVVVTLSPSAPYYILALSGETDGVVLDGLTLTIPADRPRTVSLRCEEITIAGALDTTNLVWTVEGAAGWFPQVAESSDGTDAAKSGSVIGDDFSAMETTLVGPGTLSWSWRLDSASGGNCGVDVILDGVWLYDYEPSGAWARETLDIPAGEHTVRFEFWNVGTAEHIGDCVYLDMVSWTGGVPAHDVVVGNVTVPGDWLSTEAATILVACGGNYEATANAIAANGLSVADCYVAGLSPTNAASVFRTIISFENGKPVVGWEPKLSAAEEARRIYTIEGKANLSDVWVPTNSASRFFRVKVEMP